LKVAARSPDHDPFAPGPACIGKNAFPVGVHAPPRFSPDLLSEAPPTEGNCQRAFDVA
jgi:hypothetical protein